MLSGLHRPLAISLLIPHCRAVVNQVARFTTIPADSTTSMSTTSCLKPHGTFQLVHTRCPLVRQPPLRWQLVQMNEGALCHDAQVMVPLSMASLRASTRVLGWSSCTCRHSLFGFSPERIVHGPAHTGSWVPWLHMHMYSVSQYHRPAVCLGA